MDRVAKRDWLIRFAALVIFVLGFVAGGLALSVYRSKDAPSTSSQYPQIDFEKLGLSDDQRTKVKAIFADTRTQMDELRKECGPKFRAVREQTDAKLQQVMSPEQWQQFQQMTSESRERHHREHGSDSP